MGNVIGNGGTPVNGDNASEEWLQDLLGKRSLDFSRKVSHRQYLKHVHGEYAEECLTDLPWSILELTNLQNLLDGSFNNIRCINSNVALKIPHLMHVNLSYNSLTEVPRSIALLFHLEELLLRENKLTHLPEELCLLSKLKMLDVSYNQLSCLPKSMGKLEKLERLNVSHNSLTSIPHSLACCQHLHVVIASHNFCVDPSQEVCNSSVQLLKFLKSHTPEALPCKKLNCFPRIRSNIARSQLNDTPRTQTMSSYVQNLTQTSMPTSRPLTPLLLPPHATRHSPEDLRDKIIGLMYGAILGDTIGVATEYLSKDEIEFYYGGGRLEHRTIVQDEHRAHFQRGKTTCVSDFMLLIFDSILQWSGVLDELELARRLIDYSSKGLKDLCIQPFISSTVVNRLIAQDGFPVDPHSVALETSKLLNDTVCEDLHALPIAIMSGLPQFYNLSEVRSNAERVCRTTHNHEQMIKASVMLATIISLILQGDEVKDILQVALNDVGEKTASNKKELDRVLDAALSCVKEDVAFEPDLTRVLFQGGESRIYGTVCGGILGCLTGYTRLPARWLQGLDPSVVTWLNDRLNHLLDIMGLP